MDIRIGKVNRVRLDEGDFYQLQAKGKVVSTLSLFEGVGLSLEVRVDHRLGTSHFEARDMRLMFFLASDDFQRLSREADQKAGVTVGTYQIQRDLWSANARKKYNDRSKG